METTTMKRTYPKPLFLTLLLAAALGGTGILVTSQTNAADDGKAASPKPALTINTVRAQESRLPIRLAANGNIAAWQEASVGSESNGLRLSDVLVNVGDKVRAGQVLARFSAESVEADVAQARAGLMEAEATAADAAANAERARTLDSTGALSAQQINQYLTSAQTAKARVAAARATLNAQELRLKRVQVVAPDHGIISARTATVGAVLPAGTELFRLIRRGRLEWRAEVTSSELGRVKPGTPVSLTSANGAKLVGKVRMIGPTVDPQNRAALVYVDLEPAPENGPQAIAGMFARGDFDLGMSSALTVPQQAVVLRDGFSYVFQVGADNRVQQVKVQTGRRLGERVEVLEGLKPDVNIVAGGAGFLNDGDLVRVSDTKAPAAGAPASPAAPATSSANAAPAARATAPGPAAATK